MAMAVARLIRSHLFAGVKRVMAFEGFHKKNQFSLENNDSTAIT
jgi:hypothetical protein